MPGPKSFDSPEEAKIWPWIAQHANELGVSVCAVPQIHLESLADGFAEVSRTIFGRVEPLPVINASRDPVGYRAFYNEAGRRLIADKYRDDIETFGYQFDDG